MEAETYASLGSSKGIIESGLNSIVHLLHFVLELNQSEVCSMTLALDWYNSIMGYLQDDTLPEDSKASLGPQTQGDTVLFGWRLAISKVFVWPIIQMLKSR